MTPPVKQITAPKMAFRTAIILLVFVTIFTGLLSGAYLWTLPAIEAAASEEKNEADLTRYCRARVTTTRC